MEREISLKTSIDVGRIRRAGKVAEECLRFLKTRIRPGITTAQLDRLAESFLKEKGAVPALKGYRGFPGCLCASVNNVAAHGIPGEAALEEGDSVSLDITVNVSGWHGDAAWAYIVGRGGPDARRLVMAAWKTCLAGIRAARAGGRIGDIGEAIQQTARMHGCSVIEDYVGHGIGRAMHEDPMILNFGERNTGMRIVPGMVFTVEPILTLGGSEVRVTEDGWNLVTRDGSLSAQFEHTVAVFKDRTEVLTFSHGDIQSYIDFPPFF